MISELEIIRAEKGSDGCYVKACCGYKKKGKGIIKELFYNLVSDYGYYNTCFRQII